MEFPETRFARCGDSQIAYQLFGSGSVELVVAGGPAGHVDMYWEEPLAREWYEQLAGFARVAIFDRHGTGASDPADDFSVQRWLNDIEAVIEACGFKRPALLGALDAARVCALYAATHPQQISALILLDFAARGDDVLGGEQVEWLGAVIEERWGTGELTSLYAPSMLENDRFRRWMARMERLTVPPRAARALLSATVETDVSDSLAQITCPTLVLHHRDNTLIPIDVGRRAAAAISGARFADVDGQDSLAWLGDADGLLGEIEEFLTGRRRGRQGPRCLRAILFTDIVGSTELAARLGGSDWQKLLAEHDRCVGHEIERAGGRVVKNIGDGFLAIFDTPEAALQAALGSQRGTAFLNIALRAGIHVGTVEHVGEDVGGLAVHIAARVCELARAGQVLLSSTTKETLLDSDHDLAVARKSDLRGVPGRWTLYELHNQAPEPPIDLAGPPREEVAGGPGVRGIERVAASVWEMTRAGQCRLTSTAKQWLLGPRRPLPAPAPPSSPASPVFRPVRGFVTDSKGSLPSAGVANPTRQHRQPRCARREAEAEPAA